jgi:hypothetical protein
MINGNNYYCFSKTLWTWLGFVKSKREADRKIVEADELLSEKEKDGIK